MPESLSNVLLCAHSQYRGVMMALARHLKMHGAQVHFYCGSKEQQAYYRGRHGDLFASITVDNALYSGCREPVAESLDSLAEARQNETELDVTYNLLAMSDRHLGRGYALAGFNHPRSYLSRETSYPQLVNAYSRSIEFWRRQFAEKQPSVIINGGKVAAVVARSEGVAYRALAASRFRNLHYWAVNEFFENPDVESAYRALASSADLELSQPYDAHLQMRRYLTQNYSLRGTLKWTAYTIAERLYWRLRGYEKARGYYLRDNLDYIWRCYRESKRMASADTVSLADLKGQPFVYYPLHTEPETALQTLSPEHFYQLSSIAALSRDLPAGVVLAVKETFAALGRRPRNFHEQIREFKNVVMLDGGEFGLHCAREANATATITGTGGFEAAAMGRPVISFGRHNLYNFLPHVMVVRDESKLAGFVRSVFEEFDANKARQNGNRFLQAIVNTSFDLGSYRVTHPDEITDEAGLAAYEALVSGIAGNSRQGNCAWNRRLE